MEPAGRAGHFTQLFRGELASSGLLFAWTRRAVAELHIPVAAVGPLATFSGADSWVDHAYRDGAALIGDAAAQSDQTWGQGMALTLRDARILRDALVSNDEWDAAGHAYAEEHDRQFRDLHTAESWFTSIFMEPGPEADARRAKALPQVAMDQTRIPDIFFSGPGSAPVDEAARRRFFGEE